MCVVRYSDGENREREGGGRESDEAIERGGDRLTHQNAQTSQNKSWQLFPRVYLEEIC